MFFKSGKEGRKEGRGQIPHYKGAQNAIHMFPFLFSFTSIMMPLNDFLSITKTLTFLSYPQFSPSFLFLHIYFKETKKERKGESGSELTMKQKNVLSVSDNDSKRKKKMLYRKSLF